jgi:outer membrane biosynthesis protein TonB
MQPHQKNNDFQQQNNSEASKFAEQSHDYIQPQPEQNHFTREPTVEEQPNFNAPQSNSKKFIILGIVVGFFLMLIAGAGVYIFVFVGDTTSEPAVSTTDDKKQEQVIEEPSNEDTNDPIDEPQVTKTKTKVTKTKATRTKTKTKATRTKTKTKTKTKATKTKTVATIQKDFRISLFVASSSDATAKCKDGQSKTFSGQTRFTFRKETKCVIEVDGVKGLAKMKKTGTINCKVSGSMVLCK